MILPILRRKFMNVNLHKRIQFCDKMVKVLNVAEKNDVAKGVAKALSNSNFNTRNGESVYNKNYEFTYPFMGRPSSMVVTSVSGHLLHLEFSSDYKLWSSCNPISLFQAPVSKICLNDFLPIKRNLEKEARNTDVLVIWTDCDREGENIGYEIIDVCSNVNKNLQVYRARFSEVTKNSITRAIQNLERPNKRISDAVDVRTELDLRIGASFTRFQTLRFQKVFPLALEKSLVSYGSCQFPTLGFVVERYKQIKNFIAEQFWKIEVANKTDEGEDKFNWKRGRLFDRNACIIFHELCLEKPLATVEQVKSKPKSKWRPLPLETVEMQKLSSRKLRISAHEAMRIAERLYTKGFISYPRTETNKFPKDLNLRPLVEAQTPNPQWGAFAAKVLNDGLNPRNGTKSDEAHPPIHPTKYTDSLTGNDQRLYEFIVRHFLACLSKDAEGYETSIEIDIAQEKFSTAGLMITAKNYLEVYPYDKWSDKNILFYTVGQKFTPSEIQMVDGTTSPPSLLTEADLIALMEKHGIGTDATHAEHIETVKKREYVGVQNGKFLPGKLGMGLVEGYDAMGFEMSKPKLRAALESDLKKICDGTADPDVVLRDQIEIYRNVFMKSVEQVSTIDRVLGMHLEETVNEYSAPEITTGVSLTVMKCHQCQSDMKLKTKKNGNGMYIGCSNFPNCKNAIWFPNFAKSVTATDLNCEICHPKVVKKLNFSFTPKALFPYYDDNYTGCVGGCDHRFLDALSIRGSTVTNTITTSNPRRPDSSRTQRNITRARSPTSTSTSFRNNNGNQSNPVVCNCQDDAIMLTTQNEGPNKGRRYYRCAKQANRCNFFQWAVEDETDNHHNERSAVLTHSRDNMNDDSPENQVKCQCGVDAKLLTVRKEGPNTGRTFYGCAKSLSDKCDFFQWADVPHTSNDGERRTGGGRGASVKRKRCGECRQEGHTKRTCPTKK